MNEKIVSWIKTEVEEFANGQYIAEVMSSPTEKYKNMEANLANSLLHAMSFLHEEMVGEPLPIDELSPEIANGLLFRDGSYESVEFIRTLMDRYEKELEKYKKIRSGEITKEMRLSAEIDAMDKDELSIAVSKAKGIEILDYKWPCYYYEKDLYAMTSLDLSDMTDEEIEKDTDILWPVYCAANCSDGEKPVMSPIIDYAGYTGNALRLVSDLKAEGFALSTKESLVSGSYTCSFSKQIPYETTVSGHSNRLAEAICKAYLKAVLFELNPETIKAVFDETSSDDS